MKILAINGSSKGSMGYTDILLQAFLRGAAGAGGQIEMVYLKDRVIEDCIACYVCWQKTFGICDQDDMVDIVEKVGNADAVVYATQLSGHSVFTILKILMDNHLPEDLETLPVKKVVLISDHDQPDGQTFEGLVETFGLIGSHPNRELAGMILCQLDQILPAEPLNKEYIDACAAAGREFVDQGFISSATQTKLAQSQTAPNRHL